MGFTTMTTVGYGDIHPSLDSKAELSVAIISQVFGTTLFAYVIGTLVNLVLNLDPGERNRKSAIEYLNNYMRDLELPRKGRKQLLRHYNFRMRFKSVFQEDQILELLPPHLRNPAILFLQRSTLPRLPWLCQLESQFHGVIAVIMPKLKPAAYSKHDKINEPHVNAREMYFILAGTVDEYRHERKEGASTKSLAPDWMTSSRGGSAQDRHSRESINSPALKGPRMGEGMHFNEQTLFFPDDVQFTLKVE